LFIITMTFALDADYGDEVFKGSRKNNFTFCCRLRRLSIMQERAIGIFYSGSRQPFGARRRTGISGVAAPRRCHHIACVAAPCICPSGARAKM
jgi:hypothetical protein